MKADLTLEKVRELLHYDPATGQFRWRVNVGSYGRIPAGTVAGAKSLNGYIYITIGRHRCLAHRLAWFYVNGEWPEKQIDHINNNRVDNTWSNLRLADQSENSCNGSLRTTNTSGYRGVSWSTAKRKWVASIVKNRKQFKLGYFSCKHEAYSAYCKAARKLHGEYAKA